MTSFQKLGLAFLSGAFLTSVAAGFGSLAAPDSFLHGFSFAGGVFAGLVTIVAGVGIIVKLIDIDSGHG